MLVSPSNPTGAVCPAERVRELGEACAQVRRVASLRRRVRLHDELFLRAFPQAGAWLISDEARDMGRCGEMWGDMG